MGTTTSSPIEHEFLIVVENLKRASCQKNSEDLIPTCYHFCYPTGSDMVELNWTCRDRGGQICRQLLTE
jgi:hypothetical protein